MTYLPYHHGLAVLLCPLHTEAHGDKHFIYEHTLADERYAKIVTETDVMTTHARR